VGGYEGVAWAARCEDSASPPVPDGNGMTHSTHKGAEELQLRCAVVFASLTAPQSAAGEFSTMS